MDLIWIVLDSRVYAIKILGVRDKGRIQDPEANIWAQEG